MITKNDIENFALKIYGADVPSTTLEVWINEFWNEVNKSIPMQLPVKPVDYGTCKNCIFNLETDENSLISECQLTIDEFTGIGLQFSRDFGCNQWQSKPSV